MTPKSIDIECREHTTLNTRGVHLRAVATAAKTVRGCRAAAAAAPAPGSTHLLQHKSSAQANDERALSRLLNCTFLAAATEPSS